MVLIFVTEHTVQNYQTTLKGINVVLLQLHLADWQYQTAEWVCTYKDPQLPSSHVLSCTLHLLIASVIALANLLGTRRSAISDAAEHLHLLHMAVRDKYAILIIQL